MSEKLRQNYMYTIDKILKEKEAAKEAEEASKMAIRERVLAIGRMKRQETEKKAATRLQSARRGQQSRRMAKEISDAMERGDVLRGGSPTAEAQEANLRRAARDAMRAARERWVEAATSLVRGQHHELIEITTAAQEMEEMANRLVREAAAAAAEARAAKTKAASAAAQKSTNSQKRGRKKEGGRVRCRGGGAVSKRYNGNGRGSRIQKRKLTKRRHR